MANIIKSDHAGSWGFCYIEQRGSYYYVVVMDGRSEKGPYSNLADAMDEYNKYVV